MAPSTATQGAAKRLRNGGDNFNALCEKLFQLFCWFRPLRGGESVSQLVRAPSGFPFSPCRPRRFRDALIPRSFVGGELPNGQITQKSVQTLCGKYSSWRLTRLKSISLAVSSPRGALAIVTNVGMGCGGRGSVGVQGDRRAGLLVSDMPARRRTALKRTAKPCGPGIRC
jgi:hypothetical protein